MAALLAQHARKPESPAQVIKNVIFEEKYQVVYDGFLRGLETYRGWKKLEQSEKESFAFILGNQGIFNNVDQKKIKELSEEHFHQFLLSVFKEIREENKGIRAENLFDEKHLKNGKIQQVVGECVKDARRAEAWDSLIKLIGWPFGIKIDPKNVSGSIKDGLLEKVPFWGKGNKKEDDEPALSDEQMVTEFLRKSLLPVILFVVSLLIFGAGPITLVFGILGLIWAEYRVVKSLFSNDKEGTLYKPNSSDHPVAYFSSHSKFIVEEATKYEEQCKQAKREEKAKEWHQKTIDGISHILQKTPKVETTEKDEQQQPTPAVSQTNAAGVENGGKACEREKERRSSVTSLSGYQR